jgi:hypothetical protein
MVVTLGHISHICGHWKQKPKRHGAAHGANRSREYCEIIADNLSKAGWSWGCVSAIDSEGRTIWIVDAHRGDGKRLVVHADEKLTAFVELELRAAAAEIQTQPKDVIERPRLTFSSRYVRMNRHACGTPSRRPGPTDYGDT